MMEGTDESHVDMQGTMNSGGPVPTTEDEPEYNTLDEPVRETLMRDVRAVAWKFYHVLLPRDDKNLLRDWDLWGPLVLCVTLALLIRQGAAEEQKTLVFTSVFVIIWVGCIIVTVNAQLLGGTLSFFQSLCALGYCVLPLVLAAIVNTILSVAGVNFWLLHAIAVIVACAWAIYASLGFLSDSQPPRRKPLAVYPIVLFYIVISWMVLIQPHD
eukprot:comp11436_c0_seq1/m.5850 comp11436_c0_seq1/g.5850  ORF comp11436_c0_seq1/g.5850 comp11436_c0_seq1/m.5850 type:complete len:213 (-) comp11436_c0_seq1:547-1185(-)